MVLSVTIIATGGSATTHNEAAQAISNGCSERVRKGMSMTTRASMTLQ